MGSVARDEKYAESSEDHVDMAAAGCSVCVGSSARRFHDLQNPFCVERCMGIAFVCVRTATCYVSKRRGASLSSFLVFYRACFVTLMQVLLDALAFFRALALLISVYKSFDVLGDIFITYNATSASRIRSVIAKHFRELLSDCVWLLCPFWSFDW